MTVRVRPTTLTMVVNVLRKHSEMGIRVRALVLALLVAGGLAVTASRADAACFFWCDDIVTCSWWFC